MALIDDIKHIELCKITSTDPKPLNAKASQVKSTACPGKAAEYVAIIDIQFTYFLYVRRVVYLSQMWNRLNMKQLDLSLPTAVAFIPTG